MTSRVRAGAAVRAAVGLVMLTRPDQVARLLGAGSGGRHPVVRFLGLRHLTQAAVLAVKPDATVTTASRAVDGTHVLSCLLLAAVDRGRRRTALREAALESGVLVAGWAPGR